MQGYSIFLSYKGGAFLRDSESNSSTILLQPRTPANSLDRPMQHGHWVSGFSDDVPATLTISRCSGLQSCSTALPQIKGSFMIPV